MAAFRYKYGDRPLEGYTIQRAAGRGGFGEVYYALADSGREVALKVIQGYEQIELRGVSQCMNLKSPHLVTIFDVRRNDEGTPFIIMEFVSGPSLRELLDQSPGGLGEQKAAFFLREIGKGLQYLHDCGIVHRDLKPGNIFFENGYAKIGDYGLSKAMAASVHSGQTITVGTVHYMAPEVGMGRYDKSIDIYAMGAMLYELITGTVPYLGGSPAEILMKHMTAEVIVSGISEPFASVIKKAMAKDPEQRFQSVQEMVEAVFGAEHVRNSVSAFSPVDLSMVAQRVAQQVGAGVAVGVGGSSAMPKENIPGPDAPPTDFWQGIGQWADRVSGGLADFGDRMADAGARLANGGHGPAGQPLYAAIPGEMGDPAADPLPLRHRRLLVLLIAAVFSSAIGILSLGDNDTALACGFFAATAILGITAGMRITRRKLLPRLAHERGGLERLATGGVAIVFCILCSALFVAMAEGPGSDEIIGRLFISWIAIAVPLFVLDWRKATAPGREQRVSFPLACGAALLALLASLIFSGLPQVTFGVLAGASLAIQVASPWDPFASRRQAGAPRRDQSPKGASPPPLPRGDGRMAPTGAPVRRATPAPSSALASTAFAMPIPNALRIGWIIALVISFSTGLVMLCAPGADNFGAEDESLLIGFGIGLILLAILCFRRATEKSFRGWWPGVIRPLLRWACIQSIIASGMLWGNARLDGEEELIALFFIILPSVALITSFLLRAPLDSPAAPVLATPAAPPPPSPADLTLPMGPPRSEPGTLPVTPPPAAPCTIAPQTMPSMASSLRPRPPLNIGRVVAGTVATFLLALSFIPASAMVIDLPDLITAGVLDQTPGDLSQSFPPSWPTLMELAMQIVTYVLLLFAAGLSMLARRGDGPTHMLRATFGILGFAAAVLLFDAALNVPWQHAVEQAGRERAIEYYLQNAVRAPAAIGATLLLAAMVLFLWPAARANALVDAKEAGHAAR